MIPASTLEPRGVGLMLSREYGTCRVSWGRKICRLEPVWRFVYVSKPALCACQLGRPARGSELTTRSGFALVFHRCNIDPAVPAGWDRMADWKGDVREASAKYPGPATTRAPNVARDQGR